MKNTYYSGNYYMTISDELPLSSDSKIHCKFDLIKYKDNYWGCPIDQFGTIEKVLRVLKGWKEISESPEFENIREINVEQIKMENDFINILENLEVIR